MKPTVMLPAPAEANDVLVLEGVCPKCVVPLDGPRREEALLLIDAGEVREVTLARCTSCGRWWTGWTGRDGTVEIASFPKNREWEEATCGS